MARVCKFLAAARRAEDAARSAASAAVPLLLLAAVGVQAQAFVGHALDVRIDPEHGTIAARDRIDLPGLRSWTFLLHQSLEPQIVAGEGTLTRIGSAGHLEQFRLQSLGSGQITLRYGGAIRHRLEALREGMGRTRESSRGIISEEGVVLSGFSGWYPRDPEALRRFDLRVRLPHGWTAVSQGAGPEIAEDDDGVAIRWHEDQPQDDIYLIAFPFARYARDTSYGQAQVYLRRPDPQLAQRYLGATEHYLSLYSRLIGPYPYAKFALVENFWDTGLGMPSFTLLGPQVIRLPFILHTSYPHEVLHNWWGNGVYVDYESGNWSEGLTAYLADHLLAEQRGGGADYRRDSLRAYADYVRTDSDFPLRAFRGRHGSASQAIGYGKTLMVLHMLRRDLGDETFVVGLRRFYREHLFRAASFDDLRRAMEQESGRDFAAFFRHWITRTGAPELALADVHVETTPDGHTLHGRVEQVQANAPFPLRVPLVVHLQGGGIREHVVPLAERSADFVLNLSAPPVRIDLDPRYDLFRALASGESPPTLSALFGAETGLILLPADAPPKLAEGYRQLAEAWQKGAPGWRIEEDVDLEKLPGDRPVWLLGWGNRFLDVLAADWNGVRLGPGQRLLRLPEGDYTGDDFSVALVREHGAQPLGWVATADPAALPGLARKLPHYGKYGYLAFQGGLPTNRLKGQWPVQASKLMVWTGDRRPDVALPPRKPLTTVLD